MDNEQINVSIVRHPFFQIHGTVMRATFEKYI